MAELTPQQVELLQQQREQLERRALFSPCVSKAHLKAWIKRYLAIDMPDVIVCDNDETNEPSNSSPMDIIWEVYQKGLDGTDEHFQRVLAYAARDSFKTLSASVLEILCLFHLRRNVAHMAAIESQAQKCATYISKYLQRSYLKDFVVGNNKREITVCRYEDSNGNILTPDEYDELTNIEQRRYEPISNYIKIIIATLAGANSEHASFMVLDELDLAPEAPLEEAKMIPAPGEVRGELPITFMTSSRKFAFGAVQKEIDHAAKDKKYDLQIRHWNLIDVTKACEPTRHLPDEPRIPIYYSEKTLKSIPEDEYALLAPEERVHYYMKEGYAGCLKNCSLFAACQGRLATKQTGTSKVLKPIPHVTTQFKAVSTEHAKAQLLCWKPSSEGLIYPNFQYGKHMLDPIAMYETISGEQIPRKLPNGNIHPQFIKFSAEFNKAKLIDYMISRGMEIHTGMDWGYTHNWAAVTGARDGHRFFIFDVIVVPQLETSQKIEMFKNKAGWLSPTVWADPEDPASISAFRRHGFKMRKFTKDVLGGIEAVRVKLMPGLGKEPELYFLAGDEGCERLAHDLSQYHWKLDANQKPTDVPDDKDDDVCDALRYVIHNLYGNKGKFVAAVSGVSGVSPHVNFDPNYPLPYGAKGGSPTPGLEIYEQERIMEPTVENFLERKISELVGNEDERDEEKKKSNKRSGILFGF